MLFNCFFILTCEGFSGICRFQYKRKSLCNQRFLNLKLCEDHSCSFFSGFYSQFDFSSMWLNLSSTCEDK